MSISDIIMKMPCSYILTLIGFSLYYAIRGIVEKRCIYRYYSKNTSGAVITSVAPSGSLPQPFKYDEWEKWVIGYIQEFLFKVIFTISGFMALFVANYIFSSLESVDDISTGTAVLLIFLIIWGILGISGYLTLFIASGKIPGMTKGD